MQKIQRYDPQSSAGMSEQPDGQYVKFDDYLALRRSLTGSRDNLLRIIDEVAAIVNRDQNKETLAQAVQRAVNRTK